MTSNSGRIHISRDQRTCKPPSNIIEKNHFEVQEFLFRVVHCLVTVRTSTSSMRGSVSGACYCAKILFPHVRLFRGCYGSGLFFSWMTTLPPNVQCLSKSFSKVKILNTWICLESPKTWIPQSTCGSFPEGDCYQVIATTTELK